MLLINWFPKSFHITHLIDVQQQIFEEAKIPWSCLSLNIITFQPWVQYICLGISSGEHKPSKVRDSESWERFQTSSFWPNTGFCIIYWLLLFAFKNAFNILIIWHWFLHFSPTLLLKWYWLSSENTKGCRDQPLQIIWLIAVKNLLIRWRRYRKIRKLQNAEIHLFYRKGYKEKEIIPVFLILQWLPSV